MPGRLYEVNFDVLKYIEAQQEPEPAYCDRSNCSDEADEEAQAYADQGGGSVSEAYFALGIAEVPFVLRGGEVNIPARTFVTEEDIICAAFDAKTRYLEELYAEELNFNPWDYQEAA